MFDLQGVKATSSGLIGRWNHRSNRYGSVGTYYVLNRGTLGSSHKYYSVVVNSVRLLAHRVICALFHGPSLLHVNHKNGIRTDNTPNNLEWVTQRDNNRHATYVLKSGRRLPQFDHAGAILKVRAGLSISDTARYYNVSYAAIKRILKKEISGV